MTAHSLFIIAELKKIVKDGRHFVMRPKFFLIVYHTSHNEKNL